MTAGSSIEILETWVKDRALDKEGRFFTVFTSSETGKLLYEVRLYDQYTYPQVGGVRPYFEGTGTTFGEAVAEAMREYENGITTVG